MGMYEWLYIVPYVVTFYLLIVLLTPLDFSWWWFGLAWVFDLIDYVI